MSEAAHRYPDTLAERVRWHETGTPAAWQPYTREAPDALRDGLLAGWQAHMRDAGR